ncbi:hypothetical protein PLICRDRAFT_43360 [Plicaturopsis crispa FD-325 SS-3]|nr:hypothetical protein PLICRDRAFT_43360 [Plicaturopsis crispa FD-325 SS-3]
MSATAIMRAAPEATIYDLPAELLCAIFDSAGGVLSPKPANVLCEPFILVITRVCRRWRAIALALPSLWTALDIVGGSEKDIYRLHLWFQRSRSRPVNVRLAKWSLSGYAEDALAIRRAMEPYSSRIRQLSVVSFGGFEVVLSRKKEILPTEEPEGKAKSEGEREIAQL